MGVGGVNSVVPRWSIVVMTISWKPSASTSTGMLIQCGVLDGSEKVVLRVVRARDAVPVRAPLRHSSLSVTSRATVNSAVPDAGLLPVQSAWPLAVQDAAPSAFHVRHRDGGGRNRVAIRRECDIDGGRL